MLVDLFQAPVVQIIGSTMLERAVIRRLDAIPVQPDLELIALPFARSLSLPSTALSTHRCLCPSSILTHVISSAIYASTITNPFSSRCGVLGDEQGRRKRSA